MVSLMQWMDSAITFPERRSLQPGMMSNRLQSEHLKENWCESPGEEDKIGLDGHGHEVRSHNLPMLHRNTCRECC